MKNALAMTALAIAFVTAGLAHGAAKQEAEPSGAITGLYSFLHEGEFVQIKIDKGKVTGLVSHFKDEDQNKAEFVNQSFEQAKLEGSTLSFRTSPPAEGVWFEFSGKVERVPAKAPADEGYWEVRGRLMEHFKTDGRITEKVHELTLKSYPNEPNATRQRDADR